MILGNPWERVIRFLQRGHDPHLEERCPRGTAQVAERMLSMYEVLGSTFRATK